MKECIIPMTSPTLAKMAERALTGQRINVSMVSVDPSLTKRGCGYGISLYCNDAERAKDLLHRRNIPFGDLIGGEK